MRTATFLILFSIYTGMFFSCRHESAELIPLFNEIESVMWNHPDSALSILERMPKPSSSDKLNDATFPEHPVFTFYGKDTVDYSIPQSPYKVLVYVDSSGYIYPKKG